MINIIMLFILSTSPSCIDKILMEADKEVRPKVYARHIDRIAHILDTTSTRRMIRYLDRDTVIQEHLKMKFYGIADD